MPSRGMGVWITATCGREDGEVLVLSFVEGLAMI